jgi:hypothetical protein
MTAAPEFGRPVKVAAIGPAPHRHHVVANEVERGALCRRFDLVTLDRLAADFVLHRRSDGSIRLEGEVDALLSQPCVVTLAPVPAALRIPVAIRFVPGERAGDVVDIDPLQEDEEVLDGSAIDLGEIAAQELGAALDPYPRLPGATPDLPFDGGEGGA